MADENERIDYDIFISHAGPDKKQAIEICESLEAQGLRCWIAPRDVYAGNSYLEEIITGVSHSKTFLLLLSSNTESAEYVINEVERAKSYRRKIFTIRLEDVPIPRSIELILSAPQWVDSWALDYKERLQQIVQYTKRTDQPPTNIKPPSPLKKIYRWIAKNLLMLSVLAILVFFLAYFFLNRMPEPARTNPYDSIAEIKKEDFVVTSSIGKYSLPSSIKVMAVGFGVNGSATMPYQQYYFNLEFDNQTKLRKSASFIDATFNIPESTVLPTSVVIVVEDSNGNKSEPMTFSLSGLAEKAVAEKNKEANKLIADLNKIVNIQCFSFEMTSESFNFCSPRGNLNALKWPDVKKALKRISYGSSQDALVNYIDIPSMETEGAFVFDIDEYDTFRFLLPMTQSTLYYQYDFTNGEKSKIGKVDPGITHLDVAMPAQADNEKAPPVFFSLNKNLRNVNLIVFADQSIQQVTMQIYKGVETELDTKYGWFFDTKITKQSLADNKDKIILTFIDEENQQTSFNYHLSVMATEHKQKLLSLKQNPGNVLGCSERTCNFIWQKASQDTVDLIDDIFIGYSADQMQSISTGNLDELISFAETKRIDMKNAEQARVDGLKPSSSLSFGTPINQPTHLSLLERLSKPLEIEVNKDWKQLEDIRNPVILNYSFAINPIFLKLKYVDGTFSNVLVFSPKLE
jgi:hypothetical protein